MIIISASGGGIKKPVTTVLPAEIGVFPLTVWVYTPAAMDEVIAITYLMLPFGNNYSFISTRCCCYHSPKDPQSYRFGQTYCPDTSIAAPMGKR